MYVELSPAKLVTVRKSQLCGWCGARIEKGEKASSRSGVMDGVVFRTHEHPECHEAMLGSDIHEWTPGDNPRGGVDEFLMGITH